MKRKYQASQDLSEIDKERVVKELRLGYLNLSEHLFEQAKINFLLALQFDSACADAYWGLMLEKCNISSEEELYQNPVKYKEVVYLNEYESAMQFADENQKNTYNQLLERIYAIKEGENY